MCVPKILQDEIVCGKCPARFDLAGSWSDLFPYCVNQGGSVINMAVELNNQTPIHVFIKQKVGEKIEIQSINDGFSETINNYSDIESLKSITPLFSIVKAALILTGLFNSKTKVDECLKKNRKGFQISLFTAVCLGTGIGTSSIMASTLLGSLSVFYGLGWDDMEICRKTVMLENMLSINAGWQNQYGGVLKGIKFLEVTSHNTQFPIVKWLPDYLFTLPEYKHCQLLYYTGIQRMDNRNSMVSCRIAEESSKLNDILGNVKENVYELYKAIQYCNYDKMGFLINQSRFLNNVIDNKTLPDKLLSLFELIDDYCVGYKMLGSGYSYLYIMAKDLKASDIVKTILLSKPINYNARFIEFSLSTTGLSICTI